jgi:hypothetical protein
MPTLMGLFERANLNHWTLRMETDPVSETLCFLISRIPDDGHSPKTSNSEYRELLISTPKYYIQSLESEYQNENIKMKNEPLRASKSRNVVNSCFTFPVLVLCWKFQSQTNLFTCHLRFREFKIEKQICTTTI